MDGEKVFGRHAAADRHPARPDGPPRRHRERPAARRSRAGRARLLRRAVRAGDRPRSRPGRRRRVHNRVQRPRRRRRSARGGGGGKHVSFKENLISEDITAASDPMVYDLGERRVSFAEDDTTADIDGNYYSSDPTAPLITRELIGGEEDEGEKMVNSFIASASATETIMEEDRVTWKAPLVQTIMKGLSARCCCSKQVRFQDDY
ncbi:hypothetical protein THAOC_20390 [Thalassiosira oceanica]|uniref:Uncharacterized protein n=1 Tax=Thalassiosira oceanica TaxID=159749 RepID=K0S3G5_THAOC|nr:hypothetical protein THAOC_20390 [Thalassiosira oceanica]|eukprot:EJK59399.1 hypothetical protein THAOC_20390 [Thalassiosira oceanica]